MVRKGNQNSIIGNWIAVNNGQLTLPEYDRQAFTGNPLFETFILANFRDSAADHEKNTTIGHHLILPGQYPCPG